jgi:hypothetical protein
MRIFEYPVTRPIKLSRWITVCVVVLGILFLAIITLLNIIAVGYDTVQVISDSFNSSDIFWYDHLLPAVWTPRPKNLTNEQFWCTTNVFHVRSQI